MELSSSVKDLLECPVCMTFMCPPIHQCCNGHAICVTCKAKVIFCPLCREELGNIKSLVLEKLAELLDLPCKFHEFGCPDILLYNNRLMHEQICSVRPYNCPHNADGCLVNGDITSLIAHLKEDHHVESVDDSTFNIVYGIDIRCIRLSMRKFKLSNCFGHQFLVCFEADFENSSIFVASLRFMGDESDAKKFRYHLTVVKNEKVMRWQGVPRSIRDSNTSVCDSYEGLMIHKNQALFFSDKRKLKVVVRIWKKENN